MVTPDGMPLVWFCRLHGKKHVKRVYGPDLMRLMTAISAEKGYRQFYYGGGEGVSNILRQTLTTQYPNLQVAGTYTPIPPTHTARGCAHRRDHQRHQAGHLMGGSLYPEARILDERAFRGHRGAGEGRGRGCFRLS